MSPDIIIGVIFCAVLAAAIAIEQVSFRRVRVAQQKLRRLAERSRDPFVRPIYPILPAAACDPADPTELLRELSAELRQRNRFVFGPCSCSPERPR